MTQMDICNGALIKIGASPIVSLEDGNKEANLCKLRLDPIRKIILRMHPWNCALKRATIAKLVASPAFGFASQFQIPSDCLRIITLDPDTNPPVEYRVEGRLLLSDESSHELIYIFDLEDWTRMDPLLAECISAYLAWDLSYPIVQSASLKAAMWNDFLMARRAAKLVDAQEETHHQLTSNSFVNARLGYTESPLRGDR